MTALPRSGAQYCDEHVCLSIHISQKPHGINLPNFCKRFIVLTFRILQALLQPVYQSWNFGEDWSIRFWATGSRKSTIKIFFLNNEKTLANYIALLASLPSELKKYFSDIEASRGLFPIPLCYVMWCELMLHVDVVQSFTGGIAGSWRYYVIDRIVWFSTTFKLYLFILFVTSNLTEQITQAIWLDSKARECTNNCP